MAAKLPGWDDLIRAMVVIIRNENTRFSPADLDQFLSKHDPLDIADVFKQTVGDDAYFRFLRDRYRCDVPISKLHKSLSLLPVNTIFTTNYDKLLEIAFRSHNGIDPAVVIYPEQLGYIASTELRIIKLHGDIDHPSTIVLTRHDYAAYVSKHSDFVTMLKSTINDYTILFVGFSLLDWNFRRIYQDARTLSGSTKRRSYAIMTGTNEVERRLWESEDLVILPLNKHGEIPAFLQRINDQLKR